MSADLPLNPAVETDSTTKSYSASPHLTTDQICKLHGISRRMCFNAFKVRRDGCDELNTGVTGGHVAINLALVLLAFDRSNQRANFVEIVQAIRLQEIANG